MSALKAHVAYYFAIFSERVVKCLPVNSLYELKVVWDPCQKITLLLLKSKSVRVIVPESCF